MFVFVCDNNFSSPFSIFCTLKPKTILVFASTANANEYRFGKGKSISSAADHDQFTATATEIGLYA